MNEEQESLIPKGYEEVKEEAWTPEQRGDKVEGEFIGSREDVGENIVIIFLGKVKGEKREYNDYKVARKK